MECFEGAQCVEWLQFFEADQDNKIICGGKKYIQLERVLSFCSASVHLSFAGRSVPQLFVFFRCKGTRAALALSATSATPTR